MTAFEHSDEQYMTALRESLNFPKHTWDSSRKRKVLDAIHTSLRRKSKRTRGATLLKRIAAFIPLVGVPLGTIGLLEWNHVQISAGGQWNYSTENNTTMKMFSPEYYDHVIHVRGLKTVSLQQAREMNGFPIREPKHIDGWTKSQSIGTLLGGVLMYYDFYQKSDGARFSVQQNYDGAFTDAQHLAPSHSHFYFFPGSKIINGLGKDLAAYTGMKQGRSSLELIHKEDNGAFTDFFIYGYQVSQTELENIGHQYLQATAK